MSARCGPRVRKLPDNDLPGDSWACVLHGARVETHSRDPLCAALRPAPGYWEVEGHLGLGAYAASSAVGTGPPFPGEPGYQRSSHWYLLPCCGIILCGMDNLKSRGLDAAGVVADFKRALERKYSPAQLRLNAACGYCRTVAYCGPACQKTCWKVRPPAHAWGAASADVMASPSLRRIPAGLCLRDHAVVCGLLAVEVARDATGGHGSDPPLAPPARKAAE